MLNVFFLVYFGSNIMIKFKFTTTLIDVRCYNVVIFQKLHILVIPFVRQLQNTLIMVAAVGSDSPFKITQFNHTYGISENTRKIIPPYKFDNKLKILSSVMQIFDVRKGIAKNTYFHTTLVK